jgi:uncharacterized membrane protein YdbT with pleckstrin-like domain
MHQHPDEKNCTECGLLIRSNAEICPKCGVRQIAKKLVDPEFKTILGFSFISLQEGEVITANARVHWFQYFFSALVWLLILSWGVYATSQLGAYIFLTIIVCALHFFLYHFRRLDNTIIVTDRRVISKTGIINIRTLEINMSKIETVAFIQNFMGQFFDFGTLVIIGTGGTREKIPNIEGPLAVRAAIVAKLKP